jgi:cell division protease FtsH
MTLYQVHPTASAKSGPPTDRRPAPAPVPPPRWRHWLWVTGVVLTIGLFVLPGFGAGKSAKSVSFSAFQSDVRAGLVKTATISSTGHVSGTFIKGATYTSQIPTALQDTGLNALLSAHNVEVVGSPPGSGITLGTVLIDFLPFILLGAYFIYISRRARSQLGGAGIGGRIMGIGGSKAKVYDEDRPTTRFTDIAGYDGAKQEVAEVVDYLKNPDRYTKAGAVGPKGLLLVGPPGTGKTLMARAVAGEAEVPFLALTGSSFVELFVGVGASRVRDLFADARKRAPAIIFIDEIDAIGGRRGTSFGGNDEREQTLNQLLAEMDGFDTATDVVVLAATNRPETLDPALLRPGRFDRTVEIPLPNLAERSAILAVHATHIHLDASVNLTDVARGTPGFSGAELANLVNEAALRAVRDNRTTITSDDFSAARDRLILGRRDHSNALLPAEQRSVAVHETGHALVAALSPNADPVEKITILPAGQTLGVTEQLPQDERHLYGENYLHESLAIRLGGRAAELLILGEASTGATSDLAGATDLATRMVREWGLSTRLGPISYPSQSTYLDNGAGGGLTSRPYADTTQEAIDEEVAQLLRDAQQRATDLLTAHQAELNEVVALLLEQETISGAQLMAIVNAAKTVDPKGSDPAVTPA